MAINSPIREEMIKEVELCVESSMHDVLMSYCNCCVYYIFDESALLKECCMCAIREGIKKISSKKTWEDISGLEHIGVC